MDKNKRFPIGEVSRRFHISVSSLRHYENIGLLIPEYVSPETGYRYYGTEQFEVLNTIRYLRALDRPLAQIEDFLKKKDVTNIEEKLRMQKDAVLAKEKELKRIERKINHRLKWLKDAKEASLDKIESVELPSCRIVWVEEPLNILDAKDMEAPIRKLDASDKEAVVFLGKAGLRLSAEHLKKKEVSMYDGIFLVLDSEDDYCGRTVLLPKTEALRIRFRGSHKEAAGQYRKLLNYIHRNSMEITGFSREITLIDYGVTKDPEKFVSEISIPVKPMKLG